MWFGRSWLGWWSTLGDQLWLSICGRLFAALWIFGSPHLIRECGYVMGCQRIELTIWLLMIANRLKRGSNCKLNLNWWIAELDVLIDKMIIANSDERVCMELVGALWRCLSGASDQTVIGVDSVHRSYIYANSRSDGPQIDPDRRLRLKSIANRKEKNIEITLANHLMFKVMPADCCHWTALLAAVWCGEIGSCERLATKQSFYSKKHNDTSTARVPRSSKGVRMAIKEQSGPNGDRLISENRAVSPAAKAPLKVLS